MAKLSNTLDKVNHPVVAAKTAATKVVQKKSISHQQILEQYFDNAVDTFVNSTQTAYKMGLDVFRNEYKQFIQFLNSYKSNLDNMAERSTLVTDAHGLGKMFLFFRAITSQINVATSDFELIYNDFRVNELTETTFNNYSQAMRTQVFKMMRPIVLVIDPKKQAVDCIKKAFESTLIAMSERSNTIIIERVEKLVEVFKFNADILQRDMKQTKDMVTKTLSKCMHSKDIDLEAKCISDFVYGNIESLENQIVAWLDLFVLASDTLMNKAGPEADVVFDNLAQANRELSSSIKVCKNVA